MVGDFGGGSMFLVVRHPRRRSSSARRPGKGQVVDAAMVDGTACALAHDLGLPRARRCGPTSAASNLLDTGAPFYDTYETSDGKYMAVGVDRTAVLRRAAARASSSIPPTCPHQIDPSRVAGELRKIFADKFLTKTRDEWAAIFVGTDACVSPVLTFAEAADNAHIAARGLIELDGVTQHAPAPRFSRTPGGTPTPRRTSRHRSKRSGLTDLSACRR